MKSHFRRCILLVVVLVRQTAFAIDNVQAKSSIRDRNLLRRKVSATETIILCRITIEEQISTVQQRKLANHNDSLNEEYVRTEQTSCIPIIHQDDNEFETDDLIPIEIPDVIRTEYEKELRRGILYIKVSNILILRHDVTNSITKIITNGFTQYTVDKILEVSSPFADTTRTGPTNGFVSGDGSGQGLSTYLDTKPVVSVLFVRVSAPDSQMNYTAQEIMDHNFNPSNTNFRTQYSKCSQGQLQIEPVQYSNGIIEVMLSKSISQYTSGGEIVEDATNQLKIINGINQINTLADRIVFCAPPGSTAAWMASAGVRHWRIQMNNDWCLSLTGLMHEFGHTFGLLHSHANTDPYGDRTGYMGSGSTVQDWPRKCFNGYNTYLFQWYKGRHYSINDILSNSPTTAINLVAFVDYDFIVNDSSDSPLYVIINIDDTYFIQYNRAKSFNIDTEQHQDKATLTQAVETGSDTIGALSIGEHYEILNYKDTQQPLRIEICTGRPITLNDTTIDFVKVSITIGDEDTSFCKIVPPSRAPSALTSIPVSISPVPAPAPASLQPVLNTMPLSSSLFEQPNPTQRRRRPSSSVSTQTEQPTFAPISGGTVVVLPPSVLDSRNDVERSRDKKRHDFMQQLFTVLATNDTDENNP